MSAASLKFARLLLAGTAAVLLVACGQGGNPQNASAGSATTAPASTRMAIASTPAGSASRTMPSSRGAPAMAATRGAGHAGTNRYGGPIYHGTPDLKATAALVKAGGGIKNFSFSRAMVTMLGKKPGHAELRKLDHQYGKKKVKEFNHGMTLAINDALKHTNRAGIELPSAPPDLEGTTLARRLVKDGTTPAGTFWAGYLLDRLLTHGIHEKAMDTIDMRFGRQTDAATHRILNQTMHDMARNLHQTNVALAPFH